MKQLFIYHLILILYFGKYVYTFDYNDNNAEKECFIIQAILCSIPGIFEYMLMIYILITIMQRLKRGKAKC